MSSHAWSPPTHTHRFGGISFLGFTPLTLVPIQTKMIDMSLMKPEEVAWLDAYHAQVREAPGGGGWGGVYVCGGGGARAI